MSELDSGGGRAGGEDAVRTIVDGGVPSTSNPSGGRTPRLRISEKPSMSVSPASNWGRISRVPSVIVFHAEPGIGVMVGTLCVRWAAAKTFQGLRNSISALRDEPLKHAEIIVVPA